MDTTTATTDTGTFLPAGTIVRTVNGETAELIVDWFSFEALAFVRTAFGYTESYHPLKLYINGTPLPYEG